jgi:hypothetical protein
MAHEILSSVTKRFLQYKTLGERTFEQLSDQELFVQFNEETNSISVIIRHMSGNMLSRWTDLLTTDGEKEWRHRDVEFLNEPLDRAVLMAKWEEGWACMFHALGGLTSQDLEREVRIRNEAHSVMEVIHRQLAHYAYHVGQIVYMGKILRGGSWISLSIPRGESEEFNKAMSAKMNHT